MYTTEMALVKLAYLDTADHVLLSYGLLSARQFLKYNTSLNIETCATLLLCVCVCACAYVCVCVCVCVRFIFC